MNTAAIIVAAGRGERASGEIPKQFRLLQGKPAIVYSVQALVSAGVERVIVVVAPQHDDLCCAALAEFGGLIRGHGGATRTASVRAGLALAGDADVVMIHDAARPGLRPEMVRRLIAAIEFGAQAVAPALPVADTLRRATVTGRIIADVERADLMAVQTPQAFAGPMIRAAYAAITDDASFSDDIAVARSAGAEALLIPGDVDLMKLTYPGDFEVLERLMSDARVTCVGNGFDAHRFGPGEHVTLCGVRITHDKGLVGHSDADAGWHALVDAILGALGEGDIGAHFPPSDPQWKGADSERFLRHARALVEKFHARIVHVDVTLLCERPKIGPYRDAMRARTAEVLGLPLSRVSVKATTTERMGFTGREEGLAAQATATLDRPE